jgi:quinol monooxygenase YgiN
MLVIAGSMSFSPDDRDDVISSISEVTDVSRRDSGCIEYWWAEDVDEPNTFRFFECWESQEHFDAHLAAPHEKVFGDRNLTRMTGATATIYSATPKD